MKFFYILPILFLLSCNHSTTKKNDDQSIINNDPSISSDALEKIDSPLTKDFTNDIENIQNLTQASNLYKNRYGMNKLTDKLVSNIGLGYDSLYGTRNFQVVLHGVLYRAGANNFYHRTNRRANINPLPEDGLINLCQESFLKSIYLYQDNFATASPITTCKTFQNKENELEYLSLQKKYYDILELVFENIKNYKQGPILVHGYNGWIETGMISSLALRQFCDYDAQKAIDYWQTTSNNNSIDTFKDLKDEITNFIPYLEFVIPDDVKTLICPEYTPASSVPETPNEEPPVPQNPDPIPTPLPDVPVGDMDYLLKMIEFYKERYKAFDVLAKIVDNRGKGFSGLYGTRNLRPVLHGLYYRGGANNLYYQTPRDNRNPLPQEGLENLCKEGFVTANYLYSTNYSSASKETICTNLNQTESHLNYLNIVHSNKKLEETMIKMVYDNIQNYKGPMYGHCWNGWHATGIVAATLLKQFCDYGDEEAVNYWLLGADGTGASDSYKSHRERIFKFKPIKKYLISDELKHKICPKK